MKENNEHFSCPKCNQPMTRYLNIGKSQWGTCTPCKVYWNFGYNLFSSWRDETREQQEATYNEVVVAQGLIRID